VKQTIGSIGWFTRMNTWKDGTMEGKREREVTRETAGALAGRNPIEQGKQLGVTKKGHTQKHLNIIHQELH
jgi:hypothetical protein